MKPLRMAPLPPPPGIDGGSSPVRLTGGTSSSPPRSADGGLDGSQLPPDQSGVSSAVQVAILRGKLQSAQHEAAVAKGDARDLSERLLVASTKLNEQKLHNSALQHKYNALIAKLSAMEATEKQLEDALLVERREANQQKDACERLRHHTAELEEVIKQLRAELSAKPVVDMTQLNALHDRNQFIPAAEYRQLDGAYKKRHDSAVEQMVSAFDRLLLVHEEDETELFVVRSAVLSAATDLEAKLSRLENIVGGLSTQMLGFASDCEDETNRMLLSLLNENKELWSHLTKMKYELDRAQGELAARGKRGETIPKDRYDYLTKQQTLLEEKLKRAQQTIEEQIQAERQHEEHMRDVNDALSQAKRRVEVLEGELLAARQQILGMEAEVTQATNSCKQSQQQCVELQSLNALQQTSIANLTQQIQELQEAESSEHRRQVKRLETERDDAREALTRLRSELEDAVARRSAAERDAESRASYFLSYRATLEEQHAAYVRALREEMQSSKVLLERELDELRHELELRTDELHAAARELEEYRGEWQTLRTANRSLEDENHRRSLDLESATSQLQRLEDKSTPNTDISLALFFFS